MNQRVKDSAKALAPGTTTEGEDSGPPPRRARKDKGRRLAEYVSKPCSGPDCTIVVERRASEMQSEFVTCSRACHLARIRQGRIDFPGRPNSPLGTKRTRGDGYVLVKVARGNRGWRFEHLLVMEETLGRPLYGDENVHHRNGVKDDNRPENLELWVRPQPKGLRASDAVEWAEEILRRYKLAA